MQNNKVEITNDAIAPGSYAIDLKSAWAFYGVSMADSDGVPTGEVKGLIVIESGNGSFRFFINPDMAEFVGRQMLKNAKKVRKLQEKHQQIAVPQEKTLVISDAMGNEQELTFELPDEDDLEADREADELLKEPELKIVDDGDDTEVMSAPVEEILPDAEDESLEAVSNEEIAERLGLNPDDISVVE